MEALDPVIQTLLKDAALPSALAVVLIVVLRWGLAKVDSMISMLRESLEKAANSLSEEQRAHAAIMQALAEITHSQSRIVDTMVRIEQRLNENR